MLLSDVSDDLVRISGPNAKSWPLVYWFSYCSLGKFVTVGSLTAYGFVWTKETSAVDLVNDTTVVNNINLRVDAFSASGKYPLPKKGCPKQLLKGCPFRKTLRRMYAAMERAFESGNPWVRVSMRTGQLVFDHGPHGKWLCTDNEAAAMEQLAASNISLDAKPKRPVRAAQPIILSSLYAPSFYF